MQRNILKTQPGLLITIGRPVFGNKSIDRIVPQIRGTAKRRHYGVIQPPPVPWLRPGRRDVYPARHSRKQIEPQIVPGNRTAVPAPGK